MHSFRSLHETSTANKPKLDTVERREDQARSLRPLGRPRGEASVTVIFSLAGRYRVSATLAGANTARTMVTVLASPAGWGLALSAERWEEL